MSRRSSASPATLDAIRHLARLGVRGWVFVALLLGVIYLANRFLSDDPAAPAGRAAVSETDGSDDFGEPPDPGSPDAPTRPPAADDFGPDPQQGRRRLRDVVTVAFRTRAGEAAVDLEPGSVLSRADGEHLALAERLRGGETLKTNCGEPATVLAAKAGRVAGVRRPPACGPIVVDPRVGGVTVKNFDRPVPAAAPSGEVDLSGTLLRIAAGERFPHRNDGATFGNREGRLPRKPRGYYSEFVHPTPGVGGPGPQRLVIGAGGDVWYTPDHYDSFRSVVKP